MPRAIVVGAGLAGLSAACTLAEAGCGCLLVSAQASERAQSVLAEGGINAALDVMGEHDSVAEHYEDTMRGGAWLADPNAVWGLVNDAPGIVRRLASAGVPFQREHGELIQRNFGGQRKKRTAYAKSSTGKVLVSALVDEVRRHEASGIVERLSHAELVDLLVGEDVCLGVVLRDVYTGRLFAAHGPVVLACGGMGGLFGPLTTGTTTNTGDVAAVALLRGVELANLEFLQYHPTTVPIADKCLLVSEAARGEGGRLFALRGGRPWYFMEEKYPELGNLMPRDVVSREEAAILADPTCEGVYLDLRGLSSHVWRTRLSDLREELWDHLGIDAAKEPVSVRPGIHYCMGGAYVDERHGTSLAGLYAAGEFACQYHGANRLGGNSLLGAIRGGMVAARSVMEDFPKADGAPIVLRALDEGETKLPPQTATAFELAMREALLGCMGIVRDEDTLLRGLRGLEELPGTPRVLLARAVVCCALARKESRGAHQRRDFPSISDDFGRTTVVRLRDGVPSVTFRALPNAREGVGLR